MKIPARYGNALFCALLSTIMVSVVSASVLLINRGPVPGFLALWLQSVVRTWPIAFPCALVVAPRVRALVTWLTSANLPANSGQVAASTSGGTE